LRTPALDNASLASGPRTFAVIASLFVRAQKIPPSNVCKISFNQQSLERKDRPCLMQQYANVPSVAGNESSFSPTELCLKNYVNFLLEMLLEQQICVS
jgi:hypothetical protein